MSSDRPRKKAPPPPRPKAPSEAREELRPEPRPPRREPRRPRRRGVLGGLLIVFFNLVFLGLIGALAGGLFIFHHFGRDLPDYRRLSEYEPAVMTRIYAGNGQLITEYAVEKRVFVPINAIPELVKDAFISAEDQNFYRHVGVDPQGLARAVVTNLRNIGSGRRPEGASTITQQVAKNFLLTNEVSIERKIKEAILALRIERAYSKDQILELYLNEIYLGFESYGVAAAAMNYFNKSLDELTVAEAAYLAALPKAPNNYHPFRKPEAAVARRNWVIGRLLEDGRLGAEEAAAARAEPLVVEQSLDPTFVDAGAYFAEEVRRELVDRYGEDALYKGGLAVRTTLEPRLQEIATRVLRDGLITYDRRHGWRGPLARLDVAEEAAPTAWQPALAAVPGPEDLPATWRLAVVLKVGRGDVTVGLADGGTANLPFRELLWARPWRQEQRLGPAVNVASDVLAVGDVVAVEPVTSYSYVKDNQRVTGDYPEGTVALRQLPAIEGALVALDPHTGRVLAMVGGFSQKRSEFNRATQAQRQPGSAFKPFIYLAALEQGYAPTDKVIDGPIVIDQGPGLPKWKPANYTNDFLGPTTLRRGVEKSRNLMTVRLAQQIGMPVIADTARRFGINDNLPQVLSMALGAGETTVLDLTAAYGMLVNGGKKITPTLVDRIQDRTGATIFRHDTRPCDGCAGVFWTGQDMPAIPDTRPRVADPLSAYQMVSILEGVVKYGTGQRIAAVGKPLAGKTGTTNEYRDAWFVGFSPDLAVGVYTGFDEPATLGPREAGSRVAGPIFKDFMEEALANAPPTPFRVPEGIRLIRINHETGARARRGDERVILEAFKPGQAPPDPTGRPIDHLPAYAQPARELPERAAPGVPSFTPPEGREGTVSQPATRPAPPLQPTSPSAPQAGGLY
ncbi:penicillin-binding protein 1A [Roseospirillum parvum]|uniref:Penicillin-binding protein 1A n=1 Tax=Roseospirillum parvum TaxID=83401 RepID=A0A1G7V4D3_9PROT|nr:PBP1A family penicillin-binding protein [Roseospirillum parvum]SDG54745.1 penicillin-binding protein 1A [Roseospirillum parvum]